MLRLGRVTDMVMIQSYPIELQTAILEELEIFDDNYGDDRDVYHQEGGYIILTESEEDLPEIGREIYTDIRIEGSPEFVNVIECKNGKVYTISSFIVGTDFTYDIVMPYDITPQHVLNYID